jgi:hypothetical protein
MATGLIVGFLWVAIRALNVWILWFRNQESSGYVRRKFKEQGRNKKEQEIKSCLQIKQISIVIYFASFQNSNDLKSGEPGFPCFWNATFNRRCCFPKSGESALKSLRFSRELRELQSTRIKTGGHQFV